MLIFNNPESDKTSPQLSYSIVSFFTPAKSQTDDSEINEIIPTDNSIHPFSQEEVKGKEDENNAISIIGL